MCGHCRGIDWNSRSQAANREPTIVVLCWPAVCSGNFKMMPISDRCAPKVERWSGLTSRTSAQTHSTWIRKTDRRTSGCSGRRRAAAEPRRYNLSINKSKGQTERKKRMKSEYGTTGGYACLHPVAEGVYVPLIEPDSQRHQETKLYEYFTGSKYM